ncbi:hypothetical protein BBP40_008045 [Aspergillus hancockii]|nr:hypothetical protein BBP40_008045 [Aspergillus hancockii]
MENLARVSFKVLRKLDDANELIASLPDLESRALPNPLSVRSEHRRIFSPQQKGPMKRAVESPDQLTENEIQLFENRYWLSISNQGYRARTIAESTLSFVLREYRLQVEERLERLRRPLHEEYEERVLQNAVGELYQRDKEEMEAETIRDIEASIARRHSWLRRLWAEDQNKKV